MKKRLLCLFLGLIMVLSVFLTACSSGEEEEADAADAEELGAQTITMRLVTEKKVCNTDEELEAYLANECGGDKESDKYKEMVATKAAYDAVEAEFTKLTKSQFKVNVDLMFYTEDEYYTVLEETMDLYATRTRDAARAERALNKYISDYQAAYPEAKYPEERLAEEFYKYFPEFEEFRNYSSEEDEEGVAFEEQYKENDLGIKELVYPETEENQLDIIYISGLDMYNKYIENEWISSLDEYINTTGRKLNDYVPGALLNGVKVDGSTYAIPNNIQIGEYTYMLIDRELLDKYYYNYEDITNILDCDNFLEDIMNSEPGILPINATFKECMDMLVWYWNIDVVEDEETLETSYNINKGNEFSLIGSVYGDPAKAGRGTFHLGFNSLFTLPEYREIFLTLMSYQYNGHYVEENDERKDAAISFTTGDYTIKGEALANNGVYTDENGKEYYAYVVRYPEADESSLYGNMFGVSANSKRTQACIEVLTYLNTNSELRNVLQYGVQGVNYTIDEETKVLKRLNDDYVMDIEKTGNCFIAHPEEGLPADYWENSKKQNNDALINPLLGFDFNRELAEYNAKLDDVLISYVAQFSDTKLAEIEECANYEELYELVEDKTNGFAATLDGNASMSVTVDENGVEKEYEVVVNLTKFCNNAYDTATGNSGEPDTYGESPYTIYYGWLQTYGFVPAE